MADNSPLHPETGRKAPAKGAHIFSSQPNIFFLTVNAKDRIPWMSQTAVQNSLTRIWRDEATAWLTGYFLLMPDHLHLFCAPYDLQFGIDDWIMFWKRQFSRCHPSEPWEFQRRGFHCRMRDMREYEEKLTYVRENPLRKGLIEQPEDWPYQGTIHPLRW